MLALLDWEPYFLKNRKTGISTWWPMLLILLTNMSIIMECQSWRCLDWYGLSVTSAVQFCKSCLICNSQKGGRRPSRPLLQPILVGGPFHRVAVDVLQLPLAASSNRYIAEFMDYLTKWLEVFAMPDQKTETLARLFVKQIVCRHVIPEELLSDRGANFLSSLIQEVCRQLGVKKINTSGYHPQRDGLVEGFNSTVTNMIAKFCDTHDRDWDDHLPFLLFVYRVSAPESTI